MKKTETTVATPSIEDLVRDYLEAKETMKAMEADIKELKAEIDEFANQNIEDFREGVLPLETGIIKIALNPAKAVSTITEKPLTIQERRELAILLPEMCQSVQIDLKKTAELRAHNKQIQQVLKSKSIDIVQDTRFDVKK